MFIAPYGCSWANPSPCKSLLAQCFKYRAWFKHTFLFGSLAFSYSLEQVDFSFVHTNLSRCCSLQYFFHPEVGKPVSSFWICYTSPQASGKEAVLLNLSVHQPNPLLVLQSTSNHLYAFGDTMTLLSGRVRKNLCQIRFDKNLTLAPIYNWTIYGTGPYANLLYSRTPRNSQSSFTLNGLAVLITIEFLWKC